MSDAGRTFEAYSQASREGVMWAWPEARLPMRKNPVQKPHLLAATNKRTIMSRVYRGPSSPAYCQRIPRNTRDSTYEEPTTTALNQTRSLRHFKQREEWDTGSILCPIILVSVSPGSLKSLQAKTELGSLNRLWEISFLQAPVFPSNWFRHYRHCSHRKVKSSHITLGRGGVVVKLLAYYLPETGSIPGGVAPRFSHVGIVPVDATGWQVFSGISSFPRPFIPAQLNYSSHLTLIGSQEPRSSMRPKYLHLLHSLEYTIYSFSKPRTQKYHNKPMRVKREVSARARGTGDPRVKPHTRKIWERFRRESSPVRNDNARCHVSRAIVQWYAENNVRRFDWSAQSPDLEPIEHLWDELDRRMRARQARPKSIAQLM
ncbi:hypothetical protein PR048_021240 [Dryococelus australis]|uniref:Transposase n=1 Tax=Dryococelus australis TaxID=614101 RepID=A0ABQ9GXM5_9NEOP|nr:hypothetical protein PR048_021240 [Dryococelus australis]